LRYVVFLYFIHTKPKRMRHLSHPASHPPASVTVVGWPTLAPHNDVILSLLKEG